MMGGRLVPPTKELFDDHYLKKGDHPTFGLWRNMFDNQVTVQFNHRVLVSGSILWYHQCSRVLLRTEMWTKRNVHVGHLAPILGYYDLHRCFCLLLVFAWIAITPPHSSWSQCLDGRCLLSSGSWNRHSAVHGPSLTRHSSPGWITDTADRRTLLDAQFEEGACSQEDPSEVMSWRLIDGYPLCIPIKSTLTLPALPLIGQPSFPRQRYVVGALRLHAGSERRHLVHRASRLPSPFMRTGRCVRK